MQILFIRISGHFHKYHLLSTYTRQESFPPRWAKDDNFISFKKISSELSSALINYSLIYKTEGVTSQ